MELANAHLALDVKGNVLRVTNLRSRRTLRLAWPAVCLSIAGKEIRPAAPAEPPQCRDGCLAQRFEMDGLSFTVTISLGKNPWFTKSVSITSARERPTPDFLEVDRQTFPGDGLRSCGYRATTPKVDALNRPEEGSGIAPGCGYPLIGRRVFVGLEHPAAFNHVAAEGGRETYRLRHFPTWEGATLGQVDAVFGWAEDAWENFGDYLDAIRLPPLAKPLVSFCTFWSDPCLDGGGHQVSLRAYEAFFRAFARLGLTPDVFTLDSGWCDLQSVFQVKKEVGGDAGMRRLRALAERLGAALSLWVTHNGHAGIRTDFMKRCGFAVGGGNSSAYCGDGYGVLMDRAFERALTTRFVELVRRIGAKHLKIDWDNECATNPDFAVRYPMRDHVRQASLDAMFRISRMLRIAAPDVITRNGWWPSPWWLREANHLWLSDSGDSEFAALPSRTMRDSASTHRDLMYYNVLRRDASPLPLDCFDNHEFPDAPRNPFREDPVSWTNACWLSFLRGSTYLAYTLSPESLEDWQAESFREIMRFCRVHAKHIFVRRGRMILGHPGRGEVYGFLHPGQEESWVLLRNPLPCPQVLRWNPAPCVPHKVASVRQFYPHHELLAPAKGLLFLAHEVKILILSARTEKMPFAGPHRIERDGASCLYRFPTSSGKPLVDPIQRVPALRCNDVRRTDSERGVALWWSLTIPNRLREAELQLRLKGPDATAVRPAAFCSRYPDMISRYGMPITVIPIGAPGYGERKNLDVTCAPDAAHFAASLPAGGTFHLDLKLDGMPKNGVKLEVWVTGYEAPSREAVTRKRAPDRFVECLPFMHPLGFPKALQLPVAALKNRGRR